MGKIKGGWGGRHIGFGAAERVLGLRRGCVNMNEQK